MQQSFSFSFTPGQVDWLIGNVDEAVLTKAVKACAGPFSREQLENLDGEIDDDLLQDICKKQGIDLYDDAEEEDGTGDNDDQTADTIIGEDSDTDSSDPGMDGSGYFQSVRRSKPQKRHGGLFTFLAAMSGLAGSHSKAEPRFQVGDHVRVRYRGQEGTIIDINGGLYTVSLNDGNYIDSFEESDLEKAR